MLEVLCLINQCVLWRDYKYWSDLGCLQFKEVPNLNILNFEYSYLLESKFQNYLKKMHRSYCRKIIRKKHNLRLRRYKKLRKVFSTPSYSYHFSVINIFEYISNLSSHLKIPKGRNLSQAFLLPLYHWFPNEPMLGQLHTKHIGSFPASTVTTSTTIIP